MGKWQLYSVKGQRETNSSNQQIKIIQFATQKMDCINWLLLFFIKIIKEDLPSRQEFC